MTNHAVFLCPIVAIGTCVLGDFGGRFRRLFCLSPILFTSHNYVRIAPETISERIGVGLWPKFRSALVVSVIFLQMYNIRRKNYTIFKIENSFDSI